MSTIDQHLQIPIDGHEALSGTLITPGTLLPGVLFVHGWGGSQEQYIARARTVAGLGCIGLTFDLRGHARTKAQFETVSRAKNLQDLLAAYDLLAARPHVDPQSIAVVGSSYGGYLAAILTTLRPVRWLALRAPALYRDEGWDLPKLELHKVQDLSGYRGQLVPVQDNRALRACRAFRGDVLLIQSEADTIIPKTVLTSYREACSEGRSLTYRCIAGADHGLSQDRDQLAYTTLLVNWLKEMFAGVRGELVVPPSSRAPEVADTPHEMA